MIIFKEKLRFKVEFQPKKVFTRLKIYFAEIPAVDSLFMKTFGEKWETFRNEGLILKGLYDVNLTANSVLIMQHSLCIDLCFLSSSILAIPFTLLFGRFLQAAIKKTQTFSIFS